MTAVDLDALDAARAAAATGCRKEEGLGVEFCGAHDEDGNPRWDRCRWVPVAAAIAHEARRYRALREAVEWLAEDIYADAVAHAPAAGLTTDEYVRAWRADAPARIRAVLAAVDGGAE